MRRALPHALLLLLGAADGLRPGALPPPPGAARGWCAAAAASRGGGRGGGATTAAAPRAAAAAGARMSVVSVVDVKAPPGPDPYSLVVDDLEFIKQSIKKLLGSKTAADSKTALSSNSVLTMAAREFMDRKGKSFRPMLVLLIGRATDPDFATDTRHCKLAVISEMIHTASLIHNDVLEDHEADTSQGTIVHQEVALDVGNKVCILAGDFLLAKAAVELSLLSSSPVTEIVARGLEAICEGGMQAFGNARTADDLERLTVDEHLAAVDASVAELIGNSCQCSAILSGHERDSIVAKACHLYGSHLGMARELIKEADELEAALRKARRDAAKLRRLLPANVRYPILKAAETYPEVRHILGEAPAPPNAVEMLQRSGAVTATRELAAEHAQSAAEAIQVVPASATRDALMVLCHKIATGAPLK